MTVLSQDIIWQAVSGYTSHTDPGTITRFLLEVAKADFQKQAGFIPGKDSQRFARTLPGG